jgi:hypothetical protein
LGSSQPPFCAAAGSLRPDIARLHQHDDRAKPPQEGDARPSVPSRPTSSQGGRPPYDVLDLFVGPVDPRTTEWSSAEPQRHRLRQPVTSARNLRTARPSTRPTLCRSTTASRPLTRRCAMPTAALTPPLRSDDRQLRGSGLENGRTANTLANTRVCRSTRDGCLREGPDDAHGRSHRHRHPLVMRRSSVRFRQAAPRPKPRDQPKRNHGRRGRFSYDVACEHPC